MEYERRIANAYEDAEINFLVALGIALIIVIACWTGLIPLASIWHTAVVAGTLIQHGAPLTQYAAPLLGSVFAGVTLGIPAAGFVRYFLSSVAAMGRASDLKKEANSQTV